MKKTKEIPHLHLIELSQKVSISLGLRFLSEKESQCNICFANSDEVRPEYREAFSAKDLLNYAYALLLPQTYQKNRLILSEIDFMQVPIPTDAIKFWKLVALGSELHRIHLLENENSEDNNSISKNPSRI